MDDKSLATEEAILVHKLLTAQADIARLRAALTERDGLLRDAKNALEIFSVEGAHTYFNASTIFTATKVARALLPKIREAVKDG